MNASAITRKVMPARSAIAVPSMKNHRPGRMPECSVLLLPKRAVMIGEATRKARTPAIRVLRPPRRSPSSRRTAKA
jgi:hypothetical protein